MNRSELLRVARGEGAADLVLANARVVNVLSGEIEATDVAISGHHIAAVGKGYRGDVEIDLEGRFLAPGLIDAHVHVESSLVTPREFARAVVPHGVTTVITDPHEIANVRGLDGIRYMLRDAATVPLETFVNASSCVPATDLGTAGAELAAADLAELLDEPRVLGLAEVMNFPAVVAGARDVLAKLEVFRGRVIDGHCPGLSGRALNAYAAAGISSDHESTALEEALEKLRRGLTIFLREASTARNLAALLPLVDAWTERRVCFCTDDRHPGDLLREGSVDHMVREAVRHGLEPLTALRLATINPAEHYRLDDRGAVAPGRRADLVVFADLAAPRAERVYIGGDLVAEDGVALFEAEGVDSRDMRDTVRVDLGELHFTIPARSPRVRAIGIVAGQLVTEHVVAAPRIVGGFAEADPDGDLAKLCVVERHRETGNVGKGFVRGLGLRRGALAGTVAHDHHNLLVAGVDDRSMATAARAVAEAGGGLAAAIYGQVLALLPLPIAGLMSDRPVEDVEGAMEELRSAARALGSTLENPFMTLSFLGLEVVPSLKLTDRGLVDVDRFRLVPLFIEN